MKGIRGNINEVKLREELQFNYVSLKVDGFVDLGKMTPDFR